MDTATGPCLYTACASEMYRGQIMDVQCTFHSYRIRYRHMHEVTCNCLQAHDDTESCYAASSNCAARCPGVHQLLLATAAADAAAAACDAAAPLTSIRASLSRFLMSAKPLKRAVGGSSRRVAFCLWHQSEHPCTHQHLHHNNSEMCCQACHQCVVDGDCNQQPGNCAARANTGAGDRARQGTERSRMHASIVQLTRRRHSGPSTGSSLHS